MNKTLITESHYFAPITFFLNLRQFTHCIFDQYEQFEKASFRNRCVIYGANGPINLTVPVEGGRNQKTIMRDIRVSHSERWQSNHWKSITSAYNRSPWFEHFRPELEQLYNVNVQFLLDWNFRCFEWVRVKVAPHITVSLSDRYRPEYIEEEYVDFRGLLKPSGIDSLLEDSFTYTQVFQDRWGFIPNLSIIDYLFCEGAELGR